MIPGATISPSASTTRAPPTGSDRWPTSTTRPSRTPTSARRRANPVPSTTTPPVTTRSYAISPSFLTRPDDGLQLGVGVQAELAAVAADAAHLEAAERRLHVALRGVDADVAGLELLRDAEGLGRVARVDVVVEAELAVVGDGDALLLVVEGDDD